MIDHLYNLLRLRPASAVAVDFPAPRVPDGFTAPELDGGLTAVRSELFGSDPDATYVEYRMRQYMGIIHAGRFADHATTHDRRITYLPLLKIAPPAPRAVAVPIGHDRPLRVYGSVSADDGLGSSLKRWAISAEGGGPVPDPIDPPSLWSPLLPWPLYFRGVGGSGTLESGRPGDSNLLWNPLLPPTFHFDVGETFPAGTLTARAVPGGEPASAPIAEPLTPRGSTVSVTAVDAAVGDSWLLTTIARPGKGLVDVLRGVESLGEGPLRSLFGHESSEPYATYRNLFQLSDQLPDRLTGVLLALGRRTDDARRSP